MVEIHPASFGASNEFVCTDCFKSGHFSEGDKLALLNFLMQEFDLKHPVVLSGCGAAIAERFLIDQYIRQNVKIDLLYLNIGELKDCAITKVTPLCDLLSRKGVICIESSCVGKTIDIAVLSAGGFDPILESLGFSIFARKVGDRPLRSMRYQVDLFLRKLYFEQKRQLKSAAWKEIPEVAVIVLAYMHERYIAECLQSVLCQRGQFRMRVIIIDDASPDGTVEVVRAIIAKNIDDRIKIDFRENHENVGVVANLSAAISMAAGCDYLTFCEGDDYWTSNHRIVKHIDFLAQHSECAMSFNSMQLCDDKGASRGVFETHCEMHGCELDGSELAENNFIGNFSACFYHGELIDVISLKIFDMYTVDWFFNIYCSQFGKIGHIKEVLSVYRNHDGGEWSSRHSLDKALTILKLLGKYDKFLDYKYDQLFDAYVRKIYGYVDCSHSGKEPRLDLIIIDDVFPSPMSGFRYAEFTSYLHEFENSLVLASGKTLHVVDKTAIDQVIRCYRRKHPEIGHKVLHYDGGFPLRLANLIYVNFLTNVFNLLPEIEAAKVPFVFTLYPGAGFVLNRRQCDRKLKQVFDSPCFQKVIVTQQVTYDYIVRRGLCPPEKVQMIFGVVMPEIKKTSSPLAKRRWGYGKLRLDICFMAHRYTSKGEDKGYDVFVNVASMLRNRHDDIYFHIVGPFDRGVIDVSNLCDRIKFHGSLNPEEFDCFFQDMDIIMSPNISGKISPGSFDGFPTASCIEAGIRGTAIFATDEFHSAAGHFTDGKDIVLISYDLMSVVDKIENYYSNPGALKAVGERGMHRIFELYNKETQIAPRIALLREVINNPCLPSNDARIARRYIMRLRTIETGFQRGFSLAFGLVRRVCPEPIKKIYRAWKRNHVFK